MTLPDKVNLRTTALVVIILALLALIFPFSAQAKKPIIKPTKLNNQITTPAVVGSAPASAQAVKPSAENLKFTDFTISERQIRAGSSLSVSAIVKNMGVMRSGPFTVKFYISKNRAGGNPNRLLKTMPGFRLSRNASRTFTSPVTIPADLESSHYWLIAKISKSNLQSVKDVKAKPLSVRSANAPGTAPAIAYNSSNSDSSQIRPQIRSVSPAQVTTGQSVTISGDRFGPPQGIVELGFNEPAALVPLTVTSWNNRRIVAHVPDSVDDLVPSTNSAVALIVKPRGFEEHGLQGRKIIRLVSGLIPDIRSLSSQTVKPRQMITVTGYHFLNEQPGIVRFFFHDNQYEGIIRAGDWEDQRLRVVLPSLIRGIIGTEGYIEVENFRGRKSRHAIIFEPDLETRHLLATGSHEYKSAALLYDRKELIWIFTDFNYHNLTPFLNNWVIKTVEIVKTLGKGTCKLIPEVGPGSPHLPYQMEIKVHGLHETVFCRCSIEIEGPAGTIPYR